MSTGIIAPNKVLSFPNLCKFVCKKSNTGLIQKRNLPEAVDKETTASSMSVFHWNLSNLVALLQRRIHIRMAKNKRALS